MRLDKNISLGLFSLNAYIVFAMALYICYLYRIIDKIFPNIYFNFEELCSFYTFITLINIIILVFFILETLIRKKYPKLLLKINIRNRILRKIYQIFFYFGYWFSMINLILFLIFISLYHLL